MDTSWIEKSLSSLQDLLSNPAGMSVSAICMIAYVVAFCRVFSKAGLSPFLGLLAIPPLTILVPFYLALVKWPKAG